ncbi:hypothetical protein FB45DRAFT_268064 [Roridomyces roridus]|uniref:Zn(2)-C6 fungal-type domain-containing protein n=1 Tax=Roridomyces roridus TaxID=1738132 RepID=A0AAD7B8W7_9AGAR|nr:hypothetical protein FB45DRAFT_268064 [Roridomyces roridus]
MSTSIPQRVSMACSVCRKRKVKCITDSCDLPCLRCWSNGLRCQYIATERQARSLGTHCDPESPKPRRREAYGNLPGHAQTRRTPRPSRNAPRIDMDSPTYELPYASPPKNPETSTLYRPPHQRSPVYSTFPAQPPQSGGYAYDELDNILGMPMLTPTATYPMSDLYLSPYTSSSPLDFPGSQDAVDVLGYAYQTDSYAQNLAPSAYYMPQAIGC